MTQTDMTEPKRTRQGDQDTLIAHESSSSQSAMALQASLLLPAFLLLLIGGLIGYVVGRESAVAVRPVVETPAESSILVMPPTSDANSNNAGNDVSNTTGVSPVSIAPRERTALGDPNAPVTIVEFSDYQCPFCRRYFLETFPQLKADYIDTGRVYYVYKDFPIASLHPLAYRLHEAALCVGQSSGVAAYWQVHDLFFNEVETFQVETIEAMDGVILARFEAMGLPDVRECLEKNETAAAVQSGVSEGQQLGINGTPTFFINGYPLIGAQPYQVFQQAIALAEEGRLAEAYSQIPGPNDGKARATATALAAQPATVPLGDDPAKGSLDAPITIVEYSDYQCPFCLRYFQDTLPQLQAYIDAGQVRYIFKDFPILSLHPQAQKAHEAARCARELGGDEAYWLMHDLLFAHQEAWSQVPVPEHVAVLKQFAAALELPQPAFDTCLDSGIYAEAVNAQVTEGMQLGVQGTPTFFINGQRVVGAQPFAVFQQLIETLLIGGVAPEP